MKATRFATCKSICKIIHTPRLHIPRGSGVGCRVRFPLMTRCTSASSYKWEAYRWLQKGLDARRE